MTKRFTTKTFILLMIILCPIFDIMSFVFRNLFNTTISISTFLRPIIPIGIFIYIFFKEDKSFKIKMIIGSLIYLAYGIIHYFVAKGFYSPASYGTPTSEIQYIFNFTFLNIYIFIFMYVLIIRKKEKMAFSDKIKKAVTYMLAIYIISIYLSILFNVSSSTYITNTGYKGFIESGNSLSWILLASTFICLTNIDFKILNKKSFKKGNVLKKEAYYQIFNIFIILITLVYLMFYIGTRTGLFGSFLIVFVYMALEVFYSKNKKMLIGGLVIMLIGIALVGIFGTNTIRRRKEVEKEVIIDKLTGQEGHMTGDLLDLKNKINLHTLPEGYMLEPQKKAVLDLDSFATKHNIEGTDARKLQLYYNLFLVVNQRDFLGILFGNGYKANINEMVMENEVIYLFLNFGIFGFILYLLPLLSIMFYTVKIKIKDFNNIQKHKNQKNKHLAITYENAIKVFNKEYVENLFLLILGIALAFFAGYVLFSTSSMVIISTLLALLTNNIKRIGRKDIGRKDI